MSIDELRAWYQHLRGTAASYDERQAFLTALVEHHDREHLDFHFNLLRNQEDVSFYANIRSSFTRHGAPAEPFLIEKFETDPDPELRADALQLLGHMRSKSARTLAKQAAGDEHETVRYRGVIVLGWLGTVREMRTVLRDRLRNDGSAFVRSNAATAFRQVWYRSPSAAEPAIDILGEALRDEDDDEVVCSIVATLQTIMKRRFGIREPAEGPEFTGDAAVAKGRAIRAVERRRANV